jgi:hypothetical protein
MFLQGICQFARDKEPIRHVSADARPDKDARCEAFNRKARRCKTSGQMYGYSRQKAPELLGRVHAEHRATRTRPETQRGDNKSGTRR